MNVLILGGNSYVGPLIAAMLKSEGHFVMLYNRGNHASERTKDFEHTKGDLHSVMTLHEVAKKKKWDVIIHQIAYNADDMTVVLEQFPTVKKIVMASTISVYRYARPDHGHQPFHEAQIDYDYVPKEEVLSDTHWSYARGKLEAEKALIAEKSIAHSILRHSLIIGPHDPTQRSFWYGARMQKRFPIFLADAGMNTIRFLYSHDAAKAVCQAATSVKADNETFNVCQDEIVSLREFVSECASALGLKPEMHSVPSDLLRENWKGPMAYGAHWIMSNDKIRSKLHFKPTPFPQAVIQTMKWMKENKVEIAFPPDEMAHEKNFVTEWVHFKKQMKHVEGQS